MKKVFNIFLLQFIVFSCSFSQTKTSTLASGEIINGHPAWIMQGNIYEVNVRQYTKEGTFNAFAKHLDRLKEMRVVQTVWLQQLTLKEKTLFGNPYNVFKDKREALNSNAWDMKPWDYRVYEYK